MSADCLHDETFNEFKCYHIECLRDSCVWKCEVGAAETLPSRWLCYCISSKKEKAGILDSHCGEILMLVFLLTMSYELVGRYETTVGITCRLQLDGVLGSYVIAMTSCPWECEQTEIRNKFRAYFQEGLFFSPQHSFSVIVSVWLDSWPFLCSLNHAENDKLFIWSGHCKACAIRTTHKDADKPPCNKQDSEPRSQCYSVVRIGSSFVLTWIQSDTKLSASLENKLLRSSHGFRRCTIILTCNCHITPLLNAHVPVDVRLGTAGIQWC